ncbi:hypothetical protein Poly21_25780 [Allorhodopirellula heiligendammensis]|uniref:Uncharacterized protein n=1 Tax=Allorhodopirellula heiligendammensis TaxID=2714739 RepID=A0A5C6BT35_9BACT|nr:hypothetical protein Poly21_25780 [Allorhodopirellula heiligendammensis]
MPNWLPFDPNGSGFQSVLVGPNERALRPGGDGDAMPGTTTKPELACHLAWLLSPTGTQIPCQRRLANVLAQELVSTSQCTSDVKPY